MKFADKYHAAVAKNKSLLCVGLDQADYELNKKLVDQTHDLVCTYKPNSAFYEAEGSEGIDKLKRICEYIQKTYPEIPVILDFKRGDIGNTNEAYAKYAFEYLQADAVTLHPYQGLGALSAFEKYEDRGLFVLCKTSNPEGVEWQDRILDNGECVWQEMARAVVKRDGGRGQWGIVFGATYPEELGKVREIVGDMVVLVPGVGAQGGSVGDVIKSGREVIINVSRGVARAQDPRATAKELKSSMESIVNRNLEEE